MNRNRKGVAFALISLTAPFFMLAVLFNIFQPVQAQGSTIYRVAKTGDGSDGLTWTTAFTDVQVALGASVSGDEIWVARGIYTPGISITDSFQLMNGVGIYGGFAATETLRTQRNWDANLTILSGDIAGDDAANPDGVVVDPADINGDNSYHVVIGSGVFSDTILDGFTITAGQADGSYSSPCGDVCGGGMYNLSGSPTLNNLTFIGNTAMMTSTAPTAVETGLITLEAVKSPYLVYWGGGGMFNRDNSNPILENVTFSNNSTDGGGGGISNWIDSNPILMNVTFLNNTTTQYGGGMLNYQSSPSLYIATFSENHADFGGGVYNYESSNPTLTNVTFSGNCSTSAGGGMRNRYSSSPRLTNVSFYGNSGGSNGGAMFNSDNSSPFLTNVSISGNLAYLGGGLFNEIGSNPDVYNSILWGNKVVFGDDSVIDNVYNTFSVITLTHSLLQYSGGSDDWTELGDYIDGGNNLDQDPHFKLPVTSIPTITGDLRLGPGSPAINTGDNQYVVDVPYDLDGRPRIINDAVDMGAYESVHIIQVSKTGNGEDGLSWTTAFTNVQEALAVVPSGGEIWVAEGVYTPGLTVDDSFQLLDEVGLYGGFDATEILLSQRDWESNLTILSGDIGGDDITDPTGVVTDITNLIGDNSCHVVSCSGLDRSAVLDGFTITGGQAGEHLFPCSSMLGGGMYNNNCSPTVNNVAFIGNAARSGGGGMSNTEGSFPALTHVTFSGNYCSLGGGMSNTSGSSPFLKDVTFSGNKAYYGAGMYNYDHSSPTLVGVTFLGNFSYEFGGGIWNNLNCSPILTDVAFINNTVSDSGGGMVNYSSCSPQLNGVTFSNNSADYRGGGMWNYDNSSPVLSDVTFSGNSAEYGGGMYSDHNNNTTLISVTLSDNSASKNGGGIYNRWYSNSSLRDVTFTGNTASGNGGGMYNYYDSNPTLTGVTFTSNSALNNGGAMVNSQVNATLTDVTFSGNWAEEGGGMVNGSSSLTLTNVTFSGNTAASNGGGMSNGVGNLTLISVTLSGNASNLNGGGIYNFSTVSTYTDVNFISNSTLVDGGAIFNENTTYTLTNGTFSGNGAVGGGGGIYNKRGYSRLINSIFTDNTAGTGGAMNNNTSNPIITDSAFYNNSADDKGGGMYNFFGFPILTNVIFYGNQADYGGGLFNDETSNPNVRNSILWNNQDSTGTGTISATITNDNYSSIYLTYSVVQGSGGSDNWIGGSYMDGGGNIDEDPMFILPTPRVRASTFFDFRLPPGSPAVDAGNNQYVEGILFDLDGNRRIINGIVDLGPYETLIYLFLPWLIR